MTKEATMENSENSAMLLRFLCDGDRATKNPRTRQLFSVGFLEQLAEEAGNQI